jgi:hypothetical protein
MERKERTRRIKEYYRISNNMTMMAGGQIISGVLIINVIISSIIIIKNSIRW